MPEDRFATAAPYYAAHCPGHDDCVFTHARERFGLDDRNPDRSRTRVLYLGCGTGEVASPLPAHAGTVVAVDPSRPMLRAARRRACEADRETVAPVQGLMPFSLDHVTAEPGWDPTRSWVGEGISAFI